MGLNSYKISLTSATENFDFSTSKQAFTIGRSLSCDFNVPKEDLSREHCLIEMENNEVFITDLGSKNGVSINHVKIPPHQRQAITSESEVVLAKKYLLKMAMLGMEIKSKKDMFENSYNVAAKASASAETITIQIEEKPLGAKKLAKKSLSPRKASDEKINSKKDSAKMIIGFLFVLAVLIYFLISK